jgi:hypothetical protein
MSAILVLEELHVTEPNRVTAVIGQAALSSEELLRKVLEARDVAGALECSHGCLTLEYPEWLR